LKRQFVSACLLGCLVATGTAVAGSTERQSSEPAMRAYLAQMYWPVRLSSLRAHTLAQNIPNWIKAGDTPYLGEIAQSCRRFREIEAERPLLQVASPARLRAQHAALVNAYIHMRQDCRGARATALAARRAIYRAASTGSVVDRAAANKAVKEARQSLAAFDRTTVSSLDARLSAWRSAVLRVERAAGAVAPAWVQRLPAI
jgi:hypothetical protein